MPTKKPKLPADIRSLARQWTHASIRCLGGIVTNGESEMARVAAANVLLSYGWGKPNQKHTLDDNTGAPITINIVYRQREPDPEVKTIEHDAIAVKGNGYG
jgi:hypothetical protein